jgi:hypothetical protein
MKRLSNGLFLALPLALVACKDERRPGPLPGPNPSVACPVWTIGPIINGVNWSPGFENNPCSQDGNFTFPVCSHQPDPTPEPSVHAVTRPQGPLPYGGTLGIVFEILGEPGFEGTEEPQTINPYLSLFMQRKGDNWSGTGAFNEYRGYTVRNVPLAPGRHELRVPLTPDEWVAVMDHGTDQGFAELLMHIDNVGYVFGTHGKAHGACALNQGVRFVLHEFSVIQ